MLIHEPGRPDERAPDPNATFYAVSEATEYEWRMLVDGLRAAATLCDGFDPDRCELPEQYAGALFHVFAQHAATLAAEARVMSS